MSRTTATARAWHAIRLRRTNAGLDADADAGRRNVALPAAWDDQAAAALLALAPGAAPVSAAAAADAWIQPAAERARQAGLAEPIAAALHALLLQRRGAPTMPVWRQGPERAIPGFVLNLPAFHDGALGFDLASFGDAIRLAVIALTYAHPAARRIAVGTADLAMLLALLGIDYDSREARDIAAGLAALLRARADLASAEVATRAPASMPRLTGAPLAAPPGRTLLPGLADAARIAQAACLARPARRHLATTAITAPTEAEALLGVETGGIAPAFSPLDEGGRLTRTATAALAARGTTAAAALAAALAGHNPFPPTSHAAHLAMHDTVAPHLHAMPLRPIALPPASARHRPLPARRNGYTQKAVIGGHRLYLRTGEYPDGTLGEISIGLPKATPAFRMLMDQFATAVSLGLQHGVALGELVDNFILTRFAPAGAVDGDTAVPRATSLLDYVFRNLATHYLPGTKLPDASGSDAPPSADDGPLLPLDWPSQQRTTPDARPRSNLRLVSRR